MVWCVTHKKWSDSGGDPAHVTLGLGLCLQLSYGGMRSLSGLVLCFIYTEQNIDCKLKTIIVIFTNNRHEIITKMAYLFQ